ncbi:hypothetical protein B0T25DRAFT_599985 [Lasiosphaeria hispida]|uniref:Uncharacterized protein n=1 Tax=Lasiosphaeria hispida TaxID=260671 RepID=A0AAJ0MHA1_9PEZI|nr:hypothetical protein B0T25DRAFT_599985 [Lasiosphaeria hispida]
MAPPPVTPAPSRFLLAKRQSSQKPQGQTPTLQHAANPHQFHATPRFSSASAPRSSSNLARAARTTPLPALAIQTNRVTRPRTTQDIIDDSPPNSPGDSPCEPRSPTSHHVQLPEPIEFDSSFVSQSPAKTEREDKPREGRSPKRRRISITSDSGSDVNPAPTHQVPDEIDIISSLPEDDHIIPSPARSPSQPPPPSSHNTHTNENVSEEDDDDSKPKQSNPHPTDNLSSSSSSSEEEEEEEEETSDSKPKHPPKPKPPPQQNPFHKAPRFISDPRLPPPASQPQPDIFSPQRRGERYLPGGLASELREWLVEVKRGTDDNDTTTATATPAAAATSVRVGVEKVRRGGSGIALVAGRVVASSGQGGPRPGTAVRAILAGDGVVEGLGRNEVVPGGVVAVAPPAWDIELGGRWSVAYRWEMVKGGQAGGGGLSR